MILYVILLYLTLSSALLYHQAGKVDIIRGQEQYQLIQKQAQLPKFGLCWKNALSALDHGCRDLSETMQHQLAFTFMNCFLEKVGRNKFDCEKMMNCAENLDSASLQIYNDYFIHTNNMCSFLQLQVWNEQTSNTIDRLASSSSQVAEQLTESSQITQQMLKRQEFLNDAIASSSDNVHKLFENYRQTTKEQQLLMGEVFEKITGLQTLLVGEFAGFYSLLFHALSIIISYLLTSTPRTSSARFWMFVLSVINIGIERLIVHWYADLPNCTLIYQYFWQIRKFFWFLALMILIKSALNYCDYNIINNNLLLEIRRENAEIRRCIRGDTIEEIDRTYIPELTMYADDDSSDESAFSTGDRTFLVAPPVLEEELNISHQVTTTRYYLRRRTKRSSWNPILEEETPEDFMRKITREAIKLD